MKLKKNKFVRALKRWWSLGKKSSLSNTCFNESKCSCSTTITTTTLSDQHHSKCKEFATPPPEGWFSVYVGPKKQRFNIKAEFANHPLFKILLEEAETEYEFISQGPIHLPCDVHVFCKVMAEMDNDQQETTTPLCSPLRTLCSPSPPYGTDQPHGRGSTYKLVKQSRWLKLNTF